jgi:hypothetical protein
MTHLERAVDGNAAVVNEQVGQNPVKHALSEVVQLGVGLKIADGELGLCRELQFLVIDVRDGSLGAVAGEWIKVERRLLIANVPCASHALQVDDFLGWKTIAEACVVDLVLASVLDCFMLSRAVVLLLLLIGGLSCFWCCRCWCRGGFSGGRRGFLLSFLRRYLAQNCHAGKQEQNRQLHHCFLDHFSNLPHELLPECQKLSYLLTADIQQLLALNNVFSLSNIKSVIVLTADMSNGELSRQNGSDRVSSREKCFQIENHHRAVGASSIDGAVMCGNDMKSLRGVESSKGCITFINHKTNYLQFIFLHLLEHFSDFVHGTRK